MSRPALSVVVPHYRQQPQLDLLLAALEVADPVPGGFEVVVADDGSPEPPALGERPYPVSLVRQMDEGFRLAAARNLGAAATLGEVLCFLDADTVPTPGYLAAMQAGAGDGRTVVVGRRRHAELAGWSAPDLQAWLLDPSVPGPVVLDEPAWLAEGYRITGDLAAADDTAFRYLIGAVLAVPRRVWQATGGFDESFRRYGGEDWEWGQRCWLAGADLRHLPQAVAWHDGPDLAGRPEDLVAAKNIETLHLARRLTHPLVRGSGLVHALPDVVVEADVAGWTTAQVVLCAESVLRGADVGLWLRGADEHVVEGLVEDPRIRLGTPAEEVVSRCRHRVVLAGPVAVSQGSTADLVDDHGDAGPVHLWSTRSLRRADLLGVPRPPSRGVRHGRVRHIPADAVMERWRAR